MSRNDIPGNNISFTLCNSPTFIKHRLSMSLHLFSQKTFSNTINHLCFENLGCIQSDVYGKNCNIPCPLNCKDSICNIQNGSCIGCKSRWMGQSCSKSTILFHCIKE